MTPERLLSTCNLGRGRKAILLNQHPYLNEKETILSPVSPTSLTRVILVWKYLYFKPLHREDLCSYSRNLSLKDSDLNKNWDCPWQSDAWCRFLLKNSHTCHYAKFFLWGNFCGVNLCFLPVFSIVFPSI